MYGKNLIKFDGHYFFLEKNALYEDGTNRKVNEQKYLFVNNYGTKSYDVLVIEQSVFFIFPDKVKEISTDTLLEGKYADYFYTLSEGEKKGENIYVFSQCADRKPMLIGRSFLPMVDNVYKIGKKAYQLTDNQLIEMCECCEFDTYFDKLEIHTGEKDYSVMYTFKKSGGIWEQINKWIPGSLKPQNDKKEKPSKTTRK